MEFLFRYEQHFYVFFLVCLLVNIFLHIKYINRNPQTSCLHSTILMLIAGVFLMVIKYKGFNYLLMNILSDESVIPSSFFSDGLSLFVYTSLLFLFLVMPMPLLLEKTKRKLEQLLGG